MSAISYSLQEATALSGAPLAAQSEPDGQRSMQVFGRGPRGLPDWPFLNLVLGHGAAAILLARATPRPAFGPQGSLEKFLSGFSRAGRKRERRLPRVAGLTFITNQ
jgi:hypothetical protein